MIYMNDTKSPGVCRGFCIYALYPTSGIFISGVARVSVSVPFVGLSDIVIKSSTHDVL